MSTTNEAAQAGGPDRSPALDMLRGLAVAGMVLVANTGDWAHTYPPLVHAEWNGCTAADIVFPVFLFSVGMALGFSFPRSLAGARERRGFWGRVVRRMVFLILLGLALNATYNVAVALGQPPVGPDDVPALRYPGVLQRIALCYGLAAVVVVATSRRDQQGRAVVDPARVGGVALAILLGYWGLLSLAPTPGFGAGRLDPDGSLPAWVDRAVIGPAHMYPMGSTSWRGPVTYDSEGLLGTISATANVLFGVLAGRWWRGPNPPRARAATIGVGMVALALVLGQVFPVNKKLWTSTFALLTGGWSLLALVALQTATRSRVVMRLFTPLRVLGGNAIVAFVISIVLQSAQGVPLSRAPGAPTVQGCIDGLAKAVIPDPWQASLACSLGVLALVTLALSALHRRAIHFRL